MSTLSNQLAIAEQDEVARGVRLLLRRPLILQRHDKEDFDLVRRRTVPLQRWFDYYCGWTLLIEPRQGYARLVKVGTADTTRPARRLRSGRAPFDRRRYVLFCVLAAELMETPVTTVGLLADRVRMACSTDPELPPFDTAKRAERMAFVDALSVLEHLGAVETMDGDLAGYVESADAKVLYRVDPTLLIRLLATSRGPSTLGVPTAEVPARLPELLDRLTVEQRYGAADDPDLEPPSDVQRNLWLRHSTLRRLFDEPVLYLRELSRAQRDYLASPTGRQLLRKAAREAGFVLEERAEGYLLVDPEAIATDSTFPDGQSTAKVAALLLLEQLRERSDGWSTSGLEDWAGGLLARHPRWARGYQDDDGRRRLVVDALRVLSAFRLVEQHDGRVTPSPAAARYQISVMTEPQETT
ncbi:MAG: TIGR02678 family protein [Actinomycetales bacterium]|nr:TIGR02678 family protein [Actinomycetales bacterium]